MSAQAKLLCAFALTASAFPLRAPAASRGAYGGALRVALAGEVPGTDPLLADAPHEAALATLASQPVCRLERDGRVSAVLGELVRASPREVSLTLRPNLKAAGGRALGALQVSQSWARLSQSESRSPYRALLFPLRDQGRFLAAASASSLPLPLAFPWPDLEKSLCHPALAIVLSGRPQPEPGHGPFAPTRALGVHVANGGYAGGRPYADRLAVRAGDERSAARALSLGDADVGLGAAANGRALPAAPALFATYLAFQPARTGEGLREVVERTVDRADLTRFFVRAPAAPMTSLLPPALMPQEPAPRGQPGSPPARELVLVYDASLPDQRAVAERLQVKLHDARYRVVLRGVSRAALRARWASGDFDLMLHAVLLPPAPAPALAVALDLAGRGALLARELPPLGAIADAAQRDAKARERARALQPELPLLPLYAQGLKVAASAAVVHLEADGHGVPMLDDAFLLPPGP